MARILISEHGPVGSASDIVRGIQEAFPGWRIEATDPTKAPQLINSDESWDVLVIDANGHMNEAADQTACAIGRVTKFDQEFPILFLTKDVELLLVNKKILGKYPWSFVPRDIKEIVKALRDVVSPSFKQYKKV